MRARPSVGTCFIASPHTGHHLVGIRISAIELHCGRQSRPLASPSATLSSSRVRVHRARVDDAPSRAGEFHKVGCGADDVAICAENQAFCKSINSERKFRTSSPEPSVARAAEDERSIVMRMEMFFAFCSAGHRARAKGTARGGETLPSAGSRRLQKCFVRAFGVRTATSPQVP